MPWQEVSTMSLRQEFVMLSLQPGVNMARLCRDFGVARKTGYKWRARYERAGAAALSDQPRRPRRSPKRTAPLMEAAALQLREQHGWGGRKIHRRLKDLGHRHAPAASTISTILKRHGLVDPTEGCKHQPFIRFERAQPNELWQMDFKGHFAIGSGRCHPLTVLDDHSRFAIALRACENERDSLVQPALTAVFTRYGLPQQMLMDNGPPWGSDAEHVLTALTVWLIRLGIDVSHIRPYHPQTQGKDERFHRTLDVEVIQRQWFRDLPHCQRRFDQWRDIYNLERPHESLGMKVPAQRYRPSPRAFPRALPPIEYGPHDHVRKVQDQGLMYFRGRTFRISRALRGYPVALRRTSTDGQFDVFFCHQKITTIDMRHPHS
jgi:transposase InsO family protein